MLLKAKCDKLKQLSTLNSFGQFEIKTSWTWTSRTRDWVKIASMNVEDWYKSTFFRKRVNRKKVLTNTKILKPQESGF